MTPFDLFAQDTDEVIMLLNYYILKGENAPKAEARPQARAAHVKPKGEQRIRVNDKTATGGWF